MSGVLQSVGKIDTKDLSIESTMELGHIIVVSLDGKPLSGSERMLLQVMSEEKNSGFTTEPATNGVKKIVNIGTDPWLVKEFSGKVSFKRKDAGQLKVSALDFNGYPAESLGTAGQIKLQPRTVYYLITK